MVIYEYQKCIGTIVLIKPWGPDVDDIFVRSRKIES